MAIRSDSTVAIACDSAMLTRGPTERSMKIEDYALIGDTQTAALVGQTARSTGCACRASIRGACFAALLGDAAHGRWQIAPAGRRPRPSRRRYRDGTLVLETEFETDDGHRATDRLHAAAQRDARCGAHRRGRARARSPMRMELVDPLRLRLDRARGCGAIDGVLARDRRARRAVAAGRRSPTHGEDLTTRAPSSRSGGRARAVRAGLAPVARARAEAASMPSRRWSTTRARGGASGREQCTLRRRVARRRAALADHAEGADLRADRRHRRGADDVAARADRRRAQLGLSLLLAARRDVHAVRAA